jgi:general secretion pathway protein L
LRQHKTQTPPVIDVLERLSRLLPDSTWLKQLEIKNGSVHLQGFSADASSLIGILEKDSNFSGVRFSSPVTQDEDSGRERFRISATIVGASS